MYWHPSVTSSYPSLLRSVISLPFLNHFTFCLGLFSSQVKATFSFSVQEMSFSGVFMASGASEIHTFCRVISNHFPGYLVPLATRTSTLQHDTFLSHVYQFSMSQITQPENHSSLRRLVPLKLKFSNF